MKELKQLVIRGPWPTLDEVLQDLPEWSLDLTNDENESLGDYLGIRLQAGIIHAQIPCTFQAGETPRYFEWQEIDENLDDFVVFHLRRNLAGAPAPLFRRFPALPQFDRNRGYPLLAEVLRRITVAIELVWLRIQHADDFLPLDPNYQHILRCEDWFETMHYVGMLASRHRKSKDLFDYLGVPQSLGMELHSTGFPFIQTWIEDWKHDPRAVGSLDDLYWYLSLKLGKGDVHQAVEWMQLVFSPDRRQICDAYAKKAEFELRFPPDRSGCSLTNWSDWAEK